MAASSPECYSRFRGHFEALVLRSWPPSPAVAHPLQTPSIMEFASRSSAGEMPPVAWLQTTRKKKKSKIRNQSCESSQLSPKAPGQGSAWYLWVHYFRALNNLFVGHRMRYLLINRYPVLVNLLPAPHGRWVCDPNQGFSSRCFLSGAEEEVSQVAGGRGGF